MTPAAITANETVSHGRAGHGSRDLLVQPDDTAESPRKPLVALSAAVSPACWHQAVPER
jgi:hypothetical protein